MTAALTPLSPADVAARLRSGAAVLIDIREADENAREWIAGSVNAPLSVFEAADLGLAPGREAIFMCRSGNRTAVNCVRLANRIQGQAPETKAYVLDGGVEGWKAAGLPVLTDRKAPLELMRQVQLGAGGLILASALLGLLVHPGFWGLAAFVGAGLFVAGATGFCGMARVLAVMPWNRTLKRA